VEGVSVHELVPMAPVRGWESGAWKVSQEFERSVQDACKERELTCASQMR